MQDAPQVLAVSDLTELLKSVVEETFPQVWVSGEISNLVRAGSGHLYFTLKDEHAQLKAVMWRTAAQRLRFQPHDGLEVIAAGPLEVYAPRGQYQIVVQQLQPKGLGALELALRQLQQKLSAEGLFAPERKRPLPAFPRRLALVTSPAGAAVRDLIQVISRRWPLVDLIVVPVAVQGDGAGQDIAEGLRKAAQIPGVDLMITGRGGGSLEDLWAFNEEVVARAIAASPIPVITAIGHEIDVTIADLVADRRALTPSEAGELAVPLRTEIEQLLTTARRRLTTALTQRAFMLRTTLDSLAKRRCFTRPTEHIHDLATRIDECESRLKSAMRHRTELARHQLAGLSGALQALSPLGILQRGYSLTKRVSTAAIIRSAADLRVGEELLTEFASGKVVSRVQELLPEVAPTIAPDEE
ncbi:MAG: exodeoxyribonuclease VII large subunit [Planctomycetaceae bacterium]